MAFCTMCGTKVDAVDVFCPRCGARIKRVAEAEEVESVAPVEQMEGPQSTDAERVQVALSSLYNISWMRPKYYMMFVTQKRTFFAEFTTGMMREAGREIGERDRLEGKGLLSRAWDRLNVLGKYGELFIGWTPEELSKKFRWDSTLDNSEIRKLSVRRRWGDDSADSYDLKIDTSRGKIKYKMNYFNKRYRPILSDIIPAKTEFKI